MPHAFLCVILTMARPYLTLISVELLTSSKITLARPPQSVSFWLNVIICLIGQVALVSH